MANIFPKVYGVPLSQPFRSVVWLLLQKQVPFHIQLTIPGATARNGTLHESFKAKTGVTTIPVLQINEDTYLPESPAILKYLCEANGWSDWYPQPFGHSRDNNNGSIVRPMVDAYMHWHHSHTRGLSKLIRPYLRPQVNNSSVQEPTEQDLKHCHDTLQSLNDFWLSSSTDAWIATSKQQIYAATIPSCTIADLLAYEEVVQLPMTGILKYDEIEERYTAVGAWMARMRTLDHHDAVHAAVMALGTLPDVNLDQQDMIKLLGTATKTGLKAIQAAQESYHASSSSSNRGSKL